MIERVVPVECNPAEFARIAEAASALGRADVAELALQAAYNQANGLPVEDLERLLRATGLNAIRIDQIPSKK